MDPDPGTKLERDNGYCLGTEPWWHTYYHGRIYEIITNAYWDTAVMVTTHQDYREGGCGGSVFGWSETVENFIVNTLSSDGYSVGRDALGFDNEMTAGPIQDRYHENNGMASWVYLP